MEGFLFSDPLLISPVCEEARMDFVDEMIESSVSGDLLPSGIKPVREPCEGMEFDSEEAARQFYNAYAAHMCFKVRVSSFIRSKRDKTIISRQLVCSREGFRSTKEAESEGRTKRPRMITRVGCRAMIMVKKQSSGKWVIAKCEKIHNHELGTQGKVIMLPYDPYAHDDQEMIEYPMGGETNIHGAIVSDPHEISVVPTGGDPELEPQEGMEFASEQDAQIFYKEYARRAGFRARVSSYYRSKRDNSIISRLIVCSKEGFRAKRDGSTEDKLQRPRAVTRVGCKAMVMVKKRNSGKWVVSRLVKSHNHSLSPGTTSDDERSEAEDDQIFEKSLIADDGGAITEPYEGMEFGSEEAAKLFYFTYSRHVGFNVRVSTYYRSKRDKSIISRLFVCCKEGFYVKKDSDSKGKTKRPREATRVGCKAMLLVKKISSGKWVVSKFEKEHNHILGSVRKLGKLRKGKQIYSKTKVSKNQMELYPDGLESPTSLYNNLCNETARFTGAEAASCIGHNCSTEQVNMNPYEQIKSVTDEPISEFIGQED